MPGRYIAALSFGIVAVVGWNVFCAVRDAEMFRALEHRNAQICRIDPSYCSDK